MLRNVNENPQQESLHMLENATVSCVAAGISGVWVLATLSIPDETAQLNMLIAGIFLTVSAIEFTRYSYRFFSQDRQEAIARHAAENIEEGYPSTVAAPPAAPESSIAILPTVSVNAAHYDNASERTPFMANQYGSYS